MTQAISSSLAYILASYLLLSSCSAIPNKTVLQCDDSPDIVELRFVDAGQPIAFDSISKVAFTQAGDLDVSGWSKTPQHSFKIVHIGTDGAKSIISQKPLQTISSAKCGDTCKFEPFSESPDGNWQLGAAYSTQSLQPELWLVSKNETSRLNTWLPYDLKWEWADNSQAIWLTWATREAGSESALVLLRSPARRFDSQLRQDLNPSSHRISFSPSGLDFISASSTETYVATGKLNRLKIQENNLTQTGSITASNNLVDIFWDSTLRKHLLVFADGTGLKIETEDGEEVVRLSKTNYDIVFGKDSNDMLHNYFSNATLFAFSLDKKRLAIERGSIYIFTCKTN